MSDEEQPVGRDRLIRRTAPGWGLLLLTGFLLVTRDGVSETMVGTLLGFSVLLLGVPFVLPGKPK